MVILLEYQNIKIFLQKITLQIGPKKFLWYKKLKSTVPWIYAVDDLNGEEIKNDLQEKKTKTKTKTKKNCKKQVNESLELKR